MTDDPIFADQREEIKRRLEAKGALAPCPRCANTQFALVDGYSAIVLQPQFRGGHVIGGPVVPIVAVVCNR